MRLKLPDQSPTDKFAMRLIIGIVIYGVIAGLFGCSPEKKISKAVATLKKYDRLDDTCSVNFPVIDRVVVRSDTTWDTIYVEPYVETKDSNFNNGFYFYNHGEKQTFQMNLSGDKDKQDSFLIYGDGGGTGNFFDCPPTKIITRTIRKDSIIMRRDVAYENVLKDKIDSLAKVNRELDIKLRATSAQNKMLSDRMKGKILVPWWVFVLIGLLIGAAIKFKAIRFLKPSK